MTLIVNPSKFAFDNYAMLFTRVDVKMSGIPNGFCKVTLPFSYCAIKFENSRKRLLKTLDFVLADLL